MKRVLALLAVAIFCLPSQGQTLNLKLSEATKTVSPTLYGLMTEEINYSYEGGLIDQLVRDPQFQEYRRGAIYGPYVPPRPTHWSLTDTLSSSMSLQSGRGPRLYRSNSLKVTVGKGGTALVNKGFWGMAARPDTPYSGKITLKSDSPVVVSFESLDGSRIYGSSTIQGTGPEWKTVDFSFVTPGDITPTKDALVKVKMDKEGDYEFSYLTLAPPTYKGHGLRTDIMEMLYGMRPKFLRFPGGNYLEGNSFRERFDWKETVGDKASRRGHRSPWGYWSTDAMGLLEFLMWIEDLGGEPIVGVFDGYVLSGDYLEGDYLDPFIQDALDEIEYIMGDVNTKWGAVRARDGHPAPFTLHYVEIGNEDFFDRSGSYQGRFEKFYKAIKAKYPQLEVIASVSEQQFGMGPRPIEDLTYDIVDEHYYRNSAGMYANAYQYDSYDRSGPKIFCGEWASREGGPTTNLNAALGDAAWMCGMERNSDIVIASCYAPLFVNVSPGAMQWESDLIGYDALSAYGSPSYYVQCAFAQNLGDKIVPVEAEGIANFTTEDRTPTEVPEIYYSATVDSATGKIFLKLVNAVGKAQDVKLLFDNKLKTTSAKVIEISSSDPLHTNTMDDPEKVVPVEKTLKVKNGSSIQLSPYSVTVLVIG